MIDKSTVEQIKDAAKIVDVVGDFVSLKKKGASYVGLCPFHDDRHPSFYVSPSKNYCKCFSCGKGGNPVGFLMEHEQVSYPEALRYLADKYGIQIAEKEATDKEKAERTDRESMHILNEWACGWFRQRLLSPEGGVGLAYFRSRGYTDETLERFSVGYCPKGCALTGEATRAGFKERYLRVREDGTGTGLTGDYDGRLYDKFGGRVMWPVYTVSGKVAGFGGRVLDAATKGVSKKYINSPESLSYNKRRELFGLYQAKRGVVKNDLCYVVEGYTDVMTMAQTGVENVVSTSGTAMTDEQARLIHRFTDNVVLVYDGDEAGVTAAFRGARILLANNMNVKVLFLPAGDDPDTLAKRHDKDSLTAYLKANSVDFIQYQVRRVQGASHDPQALTRLAQELVCDVALIRDDMKRALYVKAVSRSLSVPEGIISDKVERQAKANKEAWLRSKGYRVEPEQAPSPAQPTQEDEEKAIDKRIEKCERLLIQQVVRFGGMVILLDDTQTERTVTYLVSQNLAFDRLTLQTPMYASMLQEAVEEDTHTGWNAERHFLNHLDPNVSACAYEATNETFAKETTEAPTPDEVLRSTVHLLADYKLSLVQKEKHGLIERMRTADSAALKAIVERFNEVKEVENELAKQCGDRVFAA